MQLSVSWLRPPGNLYLPINLKHSVNSNNKTRHEAKHLTSWQQSKMTSRGSLRRERERESKRERKERARESERERERERERRERERERVRESQRESERVRESQRESERVSERETASRKAGTIACKVP